MIKIYLLRKYLKTFLKKVWSNFDYSIYYFKNDSSNGIDHFEKKIWWYKSGDMDLEEVKKY